MSNGDKCLIWKFQYLNSMCIFFLNSFHVLEKEKNNVQMCKHFIWVMRMISFEYATLCVSAIEFIAVLEA